MKIALLRFSGCPDVRACGCCARDLPRSKDAVRTVDAPHAPAGHLDGANADSGA